MKFKDKWGIANVAVFGGAISSLGICSVLTILGTVLPKLFLIIYLSIAIPSMAISLLNVAFLPMFQNKMRKKIFRLNKQITKLEQIQLEEENYVSNLKVVNKGNLNTIVQTKLNSDEEVELKEVFADVKNVNETQSEDEKNI